MNMHETEHTPEIGREPAATAEKGTPAACAWCGQYPHDPECLTVLAARGDREVPVPVQALDREQLERELADDRTRMAAVSRRISNLQRAIGSIDESMIARELETMLEELTAP